jgi:enoyl-CoA hydratase/carnithine racemase
MTGPVSRSMVALDQSDWPALLEAALLRPNPIVLSNATKSLQAPFRPELILRLINHPAPVLGMLKGRAEGSAASVLLACDKMLWDRGGSLRLSLSGSGEMALSILRLGRAGASRVWFGGGKITYREAAAAGWAVRPKGDPADAVGQILTDWARMSGTAIALLRPLLYHQAGLPLSQAEALERSAFGLVFECGDPAAGARAFLEKRKPSFGENGKGVKGKG